VCSYHSPDSAQQAQANAAEGGADRVEGEDDSRASMRMKTIMTIRGEDEKAALGIVNFFSLVELTK
jgi:hypothetical protein